MVISLEAVAVGGSAVVVPSGNGLDAVTRQRLIHQGVVTGAVVTVLQRSSGGGRIVAVGGSRVALDPRVVRGVVVDTDVDLAGSR